MGAVAVRAEPVETDFDQALPGRITPMLTAGTIVLFVMAYRRLAGTFKLTSL